MARALNYLLIETRAYLSKGVDMKANYTYGLLLVFCLMSLTMNSASAAKMTRIDCRDISSDEGSQPQVTVYMLKDQVKKTTVRDRDGKLVVDDKSTVKPRVRWGSPYDLYQIPHRKETLAIDNNYKKSEKFHGFLLWGNAEKTPLNNPQVIDTFVCNKKLQDLNLDSKPSLQLPATPEPKVELGRLSEADEI